MSIKNQGLFGTQFDYPTDDFKFNDLLERVAILIRSTERTLEKARKVLAPMQYQTTENEKPTTQGGRGVLGDVGGKAGQMARGGQTNKAC